MFKGLLIRKMELMSNIHLKLKYAIKVTSVGIRRLRIYTQVLNFKLESGTAQISTACLKCLLRLKERRRRAKENSWNFKFLNAQWIQS